MKNPILYYSATGALPDGQLPAVAFQGKAHPRVDVGFTFPGVRFSDRVFTAENYRQSRHEDNQVAAKVYEVELLAAPDQVFDLDLPIGEQSVNVQEVAARFGVHDASETGDRAWDAMNRVVNKMPSGNFVEDKTRLGYLRAEMQRHGISAIRFKKSMPEHPRMPEYDYLVIDQRAIRFTGNILRPEDRPHIEAATAIAPAMQATRMVDNPYALAPEAPASGETLNA